MKKRGQFYLMAAIVIIIIILGFFSVRSYIRIEDQKTIVYDLEKEFGFESAKVVDYSIYSDEDFKAVMENWTAVYGLEKAQNIDEMRVVYGDQSSVTMMNLTKVYSDISLIGGAGITVTAERIERSSGSGEEITVQLGGNDYKFDLKPGKNFIFLIKEKGYIAKHGG